MYRVVTAFAGMLACAGGAFDADGYTRQPRPGGLSAFVGGHVGGSIANTTQLSVMGRLSLRFD